MNKYQAKLLAASPSESNEQLFAVVGSFPANSEVKPLRFLGGKMALATAFAELRGLSAPIQGDEMKTLHTLKDATMEVTEDAGKTTIKLLPEGKEVDFSSFLTVTGDQKDQAQVLGTLDATKNMPGEDDKQDALEDVAPVYKPETVTTKVIE